MHGERGQGQASRCDQLGWQCWIGLEHAYSPCHVYFGITPASQGGLVSLAKHASDRDTAT